VIAVAKGQKERDCTAVADAKVMKSDAHTLSNENKHLYLPTRKGETCGLNSATTRYRHKPDAIKRGSVSIEKQN
jgi:hypothetical protein